MCALHIIRRFDWFNLLSLQTRTNYILNSSLKISGGIRRNPWKPMASAGINSFSMKCLIPRSVGRSASLCRHHMLCKERCSRLRRLRLMTINTAAAASIALILSDIFVILFYYTDYVITYVMTSRAVIATPIPRTVRRTVRRTCPPDRPAGRSGVASDFHRPADIRRTYPGHTTDKRRTHRRTPDTIPDCPADGPPDGTVVSCEHHIIRQHQGVDEVFSRLRNCPTDIGTVRLTSTSTKRELMRSSRLKQLANIEQTVTVSASVIQPAALRQRFKSSAFYPTKNVYSMTQHIANVTSSCFYQLRRLCQERRPVGQELIAQLVH